MMDRLFRLFARMLRYIDARALDADMNALRARGCRIAADLSLGPRVHLDIASSARCSIGRGVRILQDSWLIAENDTHLDIGDNVFISQHVTLSGNVAIGRDTLIAGYVTILDANHRIDDATRPIREQGGRSAPIRIGEDVWIGASSVILPGISIGDHAVIGANSTVTHDIPAWAIAVGTPARVIRSREH